MIGRLRGTLIEKLPPQILIEVGGIGYEVQMPMSCIYELPNIGEEAIIYTHFVVREDAQLLYGFNTVSERALFREVIKANGVGPKMGLYDPLWHDSQSVCDLCGKRRYLYPH